MIESDANEIIDNTIESKIKKLIKKVGKKNLLLALIGLIIISPIVISFLNGFVTSTQIRKTQQGELIFYVMHETDIIDPKLKTWIEENHKIKGIHVYKNNKSKDEKYVLLAAGEQPIDGIEIIMESVVGYEDKILINGQVRPPIADIEKSPSYPYSLLKIVSNRDSREVQLGTMNLYDVFRGVEVQNRISLDNAIVTEINDETIKIITFKQGVSQPVYTFTEEALIEFRKQSITEGDLVSVSLSNDTSDGYPKVKSIRETTKAIEKVKIIGVSEDNQLVTVEVNNFSFTFKYRSEIKDTISKLQLDSVYLVKLDKVGEIVYVTDIINH